MDAKTKDDQLSARHRPFAAWAPAGIGSRGRPSRRLIVVLVALVGMFTALQPRAASAICADDAVAVGHLCVDKYEASVWSKPPGGGDRGTQFGVTGDDYPCANNGQDCDQIYAASLAGVLPSAYATWFQAQQACANAGKRLLTNVEWQTAVQGTPDGPADGSGLDCHAAIMERAVLTGLRSKCKSIYGAYDMVGNIGEWVADWSPKATACPGWGDISDDQHCLAGAGDTSDGPGALFRGGTGFADFAGPLAIGTISPRVAGDNFGFRCAR